MALILKQSTAVDVLIGPFVDATDGTTSEEGLSPAVELSKNGQALAAKNDATTPVVDDLGYYNCELDATDTNTVGTLVLAVEGSATHLPVRHEYQVVEENVYDAIYAGSAALGTDVASILTDTGTTLNDKIDTIDGIVDDILLDTAEIGAAGAGLTEAGGDGDHLTAIDLPNQTMDITGNLSGSVGSVTGNVGGTINGLTATALADFFDTDSGTTYGSAVGGSVVAEIADNAGGSALTEDGIADAVWDELQSGHAGAGTFGEIATEIATILTDTNELQTDDVPGLIGALNDVSSADVNAACDTALSDYDAPTKTEMDSAFAALNDPTVDEIADGVWDEAAAGHVSAGTFGVQCGTDIDAILTDTAEIGAAGAGLTEAGGTGDQLTAVPWNAAWDAQVQSEVEDGLAAYDPPTKAELDTAQSSIESAISGLNDPTAAAIADAVWEEAQADHVGAGSFGEIATEIASILTDTGEIGAAGAGLTEAGGTGDQLTAVPWNSAWDAQVQSEAADALVAYDPPTKAELDTAQTAVTDAIAALENLSASEVNDEVVDALATDTYAEPGQGAPAATASLAAKVNYLYKSWRNKKDNDGSNTQLYADDGSTVDHKQSTAESGGTVTKGEWITGA